MRFKGIQEQFQDTFGLHCLNKRTLNKLVIFTFISM